MRLYDDDGETFDYERGQRSWTRLAIARGAAGSVTPSSAGARWRYSDVRFVQMTK